MDTLIQQGMAEHMPALLRSSNSSLPRHSATPSILKGKEAKVLIQIHSIISLYQFTTS